MTDEHMDADGPTRLFPEGHARLLPDAPPPGPARLLTPPRRTPPMTDQMLLRMTEAIVTPLTDTLSDGNSPCMEMIPSYNAILGTAQANHPDEPFLRLLAPIEKSGFVNVSQLLALFAQLRIVLESYQTPPPSPQ